MVGLYAFPKEERIRRRSEFLKTLREGTKFQTEHFLISFRLNGLAGHRLGITVGKRVGSAVVRNRLKRRIREFWRRNRPLFPEAMDVVITAKAGAALLTFWRAAEELRGFFKER